MKHTLTARIGRWSFRHRWSVAAIWLIAVVAGALAAGPVFAGLKDDNGPASLESVQGINQINAADPSAGTVVGIVSGVNPHSATVRAAVAATTTQLRRIDGVASVSAPVVAADGRGLAIDVKLTKLSDDAQQQTDDAVAAALHELGPPLHASVLVGGGPLVDDQANAQAQKDLSGAEELSLPITLLILIVVFGGIIAAGLPVLAAVVSIAASLSILLIFSKLTSLDSDAVTVITLLGLGLSIDYGLLLVARYRDELAAGFEPIDAIGRAWATAGRTILFSALTVAAALSGMLVFGVTALSALGAAGVSITLVAMLVSLTFTAALLRIAGRRVRPSKRAARRALTSSGDLDRGGFFAGLATAVQRRPLVTALATGLVLIAAGLPILGMTTRMDNVDGLPRSLESVRAMDVQAAQYHQPTSTAVTVVARMDVARLNAWAATIRSTAGITRVHPAQAVGAHLASVDIDTTGTTEGATALRVVDVLRAHRPAGVQSWVTGDAALHKDVMTLIWHRLPYAIGLTLLAMIVLLFAMTGSLVVPIKAVLMNLISLSATFGALVAIFEHGVFAGLLHTTTVIGMSPFVIVTVFAFAFGLSMDYEVFLLARIKEQVDRGAPTEVAVRRGLQNSGRIITSAALLMVVVFSCFVTGRISNVQEIGLGLAIAIAVDATLVRCVLVPATMTLLGRANWWAPAWLARGRKRLGLDRYLTESEVDAPAAERAPELVSVG
jgi:RND superfamily putative drug exporter